MTFRRLLSHVPLLLLVLSFCIASAVYGMALVAYEWYPYEHLYDMYRVVTKDTVTPEEDLLNFTNTSIDDMPAERFELMSGEAENTLWHGGQDRFLDICPEDGCMAVMFNRDGEVVYAWPYLIDDLEAFLPLAKDWGNELSFAIGPSLRGGASDVMSAVRHDRDLIVQFRNRNTFPAKGVVVRVDPEGRPVWADVDWGTHHWMNLVESEGVLIIPGSVAVDMDTMEEAPVSIDCGRGPLHRDVLVIVDPLDGRLIETIDVFQSVMESPYYRYLIRYELPCYPLHLNYVDVLREDVTGIPGANPGDIVVSLKGPSAFAILDRSTHEVIRLSKGTFLAQHSVQHLRGSQFILFDNNGGGDSSRVLVVDLADGSERTLFPNDDTPPELRNLYTVYRGTLSVSDDRSRVLATFSMNGVAVEMRIADGKILNVYRNLHDVSTSKFFANHPGDTGGAALMVSSGIYYEE